MGPATLVSLEEYVATTYRPGCDFVDGLLIERDRHELRLSALADLLPIDD